MFRYGAKRPLDQSTVRGIYSIGGDLKREVQKVNIRTFRMDGEELRVEEFIGYVKEVLGGKEKNEETFYFLEVWEGSDMEVVIGPPGHSRLAELAGYHQKGDEPGPIVGGGLVKFWFRDMKAWNQERGDHIVRKHYVDFNNGSGTYGMFSVKLMEEEIVQILADQLQTECTVSRVVWACPGSKAP